MKSNHLDKFKSENDLILFVIKFRNKNLDDNLITKIIEDYEKNSLLFLTKKYLIKYKDIQLLFKVLNVKIKNISESNCQESVRNKYKETCMNIFGVENASQSNEIKIKKANTFIEHYGVDNIFKDEKFKSTLNNIIFKKYGVNRVTNYDKTIETNLERYGIKHPAEMPSVLEGYQNYWNNLSKNEQFIIINKLLNSQTYCSKIELRIKNILEKFNLNIKHTFFIGNKNYDFYIKEYNLIIEVNGDFWHANPIYYKPDDIMKFPKKSKIASDIWAKDKLKKELAESLNYNILYIWENEINKYTDDEIIELLSKEFEKCKQ